MFEVVERCQRNDFSIRNAFGSTRGSFAFGVRSPPRDLQARPSLRLRR